MAAYWFLTDFDDLFSGTPDEDFLFGFDGRDTLAGGAGNDSLDGGNGNDSLTGGSGNDTLLGGVGNDTLDGEEDVNVLKGGAGDDLYWVNGLGDSIMESGGAGSDWVNTMIDYTLGANLENISLLPGDAHLATGNVLNNLIFGNILDNTLRGEGGNDTVFGLSGVDFLYGGSGDDSLDGGIGDDLLFGDDGNDTLVGGDGVDQLYGRSGNDSLIGGPGNDHFYGDAGNDTLDGGTGTDYLEGGAGNDLYYVDDLTESVVEYTTEINSATGEIIYKDLGGYDTIFSLVDNFSLPSYTEKLVLVGAILQGQGNGGANTLVGNAANNTLFGHGGNDTLQGGLGEDTLLGGAGNDFLQGEAGDDELNGEGGNDSMLGGAGSDTYFVNSAADRVYETTTISSNTDSGGALDHVISDVDYVLGKFVESLQLTNYAIKATGNDQENFLVGNNWDNILDGKGNADHMTGGNGSDTYYVDHAGDLVVESGTGTADAVFSSVTYTLTLNVENLTLTGGAKIDGIGNDGANLLIGNAGINGLTGGSGDDTLDGKAGADELNGGAGDDSYYVDALGDVIVDSSGTDTVYSLLSFTLGNGVENLVLSGTAKNGTGNGGANNITGNGAANLLRGEGGADTLTGGAGGDTLFGGSGDDTYGVDSAGDRVYETTSPTSNVDSGGVDLVSSSVSFTLGSFIEALYLSGSGHINGVGNTGSNTLIGNTGNNTLDGGGGSDTLFGWGGDDIYIVNGADTVTEAPDLGTDTVQSSVTYLLPDNVENLTLTGSGAINGIGNGLNNFLLGNSGDNQLLGGIGHDSLDGGPGSDNLQGGSGDDIYFIDDLDTVSEDFNAGTDTLIWGNSTGGWTGYGLSANFEKLILTGSKDLNGDGNAENNLLVGNSGKNRLEGRAGHDTLNGGAGADTLIGGADNDLYYVDNTLDIVEEEIGGGVDTVFSTVSHILTANCETLYLTGTATINGTGNALSNILYGNSKNNKLLGGEGADILHGGSGSDTLTGGGGTDVFVFETALGAAINKDTIVDMIHNSDKIHLDDDIFSQLNAGVLNAANFVANATGKAMESDDYIVYNTTTGALFYDADGNSNGAAVQFASLSNKPTNITAGDFLVVT